MSSDPDERLGPVWSALGGDPELLERVVVSGPRTVLPSVFDVTGLATATVAAATLAAAELRAARSGGEVPRVGVERRRAAAAFASEGLFTPIGWSRAAAWDPIAGNYRSRTGWIRLHTNYRHHRVAVARTLGADTRAAVAAAVAEWDAAALENAITEAGGCAAVMHDRRGWLSTPAGRATRTEPLARITPTSVADPLTALNADPARPFSGLRVLDLTRVIAGPVCTRFLAAYGADVLRVDPPGFEEVPALVPDTTVGKRTAALDLSTAPGRQVFEGLIRRADVLVCGLRPQALTRLGYDPAALSALNPTLITASLNAYGWSGPWRDRRGFDSLVQMSCGIAAAGAAALEQDEPAPLPVQALDHGTGYLLAAAIGRALTERLTQGTVSDLRTSLVGTANALMGWTSPADAGSEAARPDAELEATSTFWGPARRVPLPGSIDGMAHDWTVEAGPIGRHEPSWRHRAQAGSRS